METSVCKAVGPSYYPACLHVELQPWLRAAAFHTALFLTATEHRACVAEMLAGRTRAGRQRPLPWRSCVQLPPARARRCAWGQLSTSPFWKRVYRNIVVIPSVHHHESKVLWVGGVCTCSSGKGRIAASVLAEGTETSHWPSGRSRNLPLARSTWRCCIWNMALPFPDSDRDFSGAMNAFPTVFPCPSNICNSKMWILLLCLNIFFCRQSRTRLLETKRY